MPLSHLQHYFTIFIIFQARNKKRHFWYDVVMIGTSNELLVQSWLPICIGRKKKSFRDHKDTIHFDRRQTFTYLAFARKRKIWRERERERERERKKN